MFLTTVKNCDSVPMGQVVTHLAMSKYPVTESTQPPTKTTYSK